jgi:ribokinase
MGRVLVLGASLMDMNLRLDRLPTPGETRLGSSFFTSTGGKGANQAVAARRAGAEVVFLTAFGDDAFGQQMRDRYFAQGIDLRHARLVDSEASGVALILVGDDGENLIGVAMGPNARLTPEFIDALPADVFDPSGVFLASLEVPIETVIRGIERAKQAGMTVILNPAPASLLLGEMQLLDNVDVLTPNVAEIRELAGRGYQEGWDAAWRASGALFDRGLANAVVTLGADGCFVQSTPEGVPTMIKAYEVEAIDTVGAGDAFNGALAAALAEGLDLVRAATRANAAAAIAVTKPGAQGALPSRDEIDRMVALSQRTED